VESEGIIKNGSTVTADALEVDGGGFRLDTTSSATVLGNFSIRNSGFAGFSRIGGTLFVKGTLFNSDSSDPGATTIIDGLARVHAVQNDGDMTVNGKLEVNSGGLINNGLGTLTISGVTNVTGGVTAAGFGVTLGITFTLRRFIQGAFSMSNESRGIGLFQAVWILAGLLVAVAARFHLFHSIDGSSVRFGTPYQAVLLSY
jgi:hypothetical protein